MALYCLTSPGEKKMTKVKVRLQANTKEDCEKLRKHFLKKHPQMIMSKPREGTNPKYEGRQKWSCYGDYQFGVIRQRRS